MRTFLYRVCSSSHCSISSSRVLWTANCHVLLRRRFLNRPRPLSFWLVLAFFLF